MIPWRAGSSRRMRPPSAGSGKLSMPIRSARRWVPGSPGGWQPVTGGQGTATESGGAGRGRQVGAGHPPCQRRRAGRAPAGGRRSAGQRRARPGRRGRQSNEITAFAPLLEPLDLTGAVITADAMHTQREHARFLVSDKKAHYILVVKKNQPSCTPRSRTWPGATSRPVTGNAAAGTAAKSTARCRPPPSPPGCLPPRRPGHPPHPPDPAHLQREEMADRHHLRHHQPDRRQATAAELAAWIRGHWQIEAIHHVVLQGWVWLLHPVAPTRHGCRLAADLLGCGARGW